MTTTVESLDKAAEHINAIGERFRKSEFASFMAAELTHLEDVHQGYFDAQSGPTGQSWEPWFWRPAWAPNDHPTLEITGTLRQSLALGGSSNISSSDARSLEFGTSVAYAGLQNFGGEVVFTESMVGRSGGFLPAGATVELPAREHVGVSDDYVDSMMDRLADEVMRGIAGE